MRKFLLLFLLLICLASSSSAQTCYTGHFSFDVPDSWNMSIFDDSLVLDSYDGDCLFVFESDMRENGILTKEGINSLYSLSSESATSRLIEDHYSDPVCYLYKDSSKCGQFMFYKNGYLLLLSLYSYKNNVGEDYCINKIREIAKTSSYFVSTSSAYSSGLWRTYTFSFANASIDVPPNAYVLHPEINKDNPALSFYGFTPEEAKLYLQNSNTDMFANLGNGKELLVTFADYTEDSSMNLLTYEELRSIGESYRENIERNGDTFLYSKPFIHDQQKYCRIAFAQNIDGHSYHTMIYLTDWYKRPVFFAFSSYTSAFTGDDELLFDRIVGTLCEY